MVRLFDTNALTGGDPDRVRKVNLFTTPRCVADVHVLSCGQAARVHAHAAQDKVYHVLSGRGTVTVGDAEHAVAAGHLVFCPAGVPHGARNDGPEDLRLLVFLAPRPPVPGDAAAE